MTRPTPINRRQLLRAGIAVLGSTAATSLAAAVTPSQAKGPFYPSTAAVDSDTDLTQVPGSATRAEGELLRIEGLILDESLTPIADALVEIWQANSFGRYLHERDNSAAQLDPNFQGWGRMLSDAQGRYSFTTVKPGPYPATRDWMRPPHIHFKVARRGYQELITQLYFADDPLNQADRLLAQVDPSERERLITTLQPDPHGQTGVFDIILKPV